MDEWLNSSAIYDNFGNVFWKNQFTKENNVFGLGYGAAGVALFLLRLYELVGDDRIRYLGEKAINSEMNKSKLVLKNLRSFSNGKNYEPYLEEGTAGVLKVALRYNLKNKIFEELLNDLRRKYLVLPGYLFGTAGIIDTLLDIILISEKKDLFEVLDKQLDGLFHVHIFDPITTCNFNNNNNNNNNMLKGSLIG